MKYIISYCSGGIGNRLLPLSSCFELSHKLSRNLGLVWNKTDICHAEFNNLYSNEIKNFRLIDLDPSEVSIYSNVDYIVGDMNMYKDPSLFNLYNKAGIKNLSQLNEVFEDQKKYIIIYDNNLFLDFTDIQSFLKFLEPVNKIKNVINDFVSLNNINYNVLGIHARGTDFVDDKLDDYLSIINDYIKADNNCRILFCSDSRTWEVKVKDTFPNNVIVRKKNGYSKKSNFFRGWSNNTHRSEASVIEGIVDIYLLSYTNLVVYNKHSTFAQMVKHLISLRIN
ncbi:O-fucosyltransferase family protein [Aquirufa sp. A-Brett2-W8]|jgi:hypothetical protein